MRPGSLVSREAPGKGSVRSGDLAQTSGLVGIEPAVQRHPPGQPLQREDLEDGPELLRDPGCRDREALRRANEEWRDTELAESFDDGCHRGTTCTGRDDGNDGDARIDHRERAVEQVGTREWVGREIARLHELESSL